MRRRLLVNKDKPIVVNGYEFVDMGLSVMWATCNIGAKKPEEYGYYFQWGGTTAYNSDRTPVEGGEAIRFDYNSNCPFYVNDYLTSSKWSKYTADDSYSSTGVADNKLTLDLEDDAAHVHIGGECRMPTYDEYSELKNACNTTWVRDYNGTGINGRLFTLKDDPSKTLFFPASGELYLTSGANHGSAGYNWSSSLNSTFLYSGMGLLSNSTSCRMTYDERHNGAPIRGVLPK